MKIANFLPVTIFAASLLAVGSTSAQVLTPGGVIQGNSTPEFAGATVGPLGHRKGGVFGSFASTDNWAALGESPFGFGGVLPYGLRLQKNAQFGLLNLVTNSAKLSPPEDLVVAWGQNTSASVRFRFISNQFSSTGFLDALTIASNGAVKVAGSVTAQGILLSSDRRFKEQIAPLANGLGLIRRMEGETYQFKQTGEFAGRHFPAEKQYGFIAQDLQKIMPEAVVKQDDGYYAVNYIAVIPVLVEAVKQLDAKQAETAQLQKELADMKAQMADLRALVEKSTGKTSADKVGTANPDLAQVQLEQNSPNPFSQVTRIEYSLPVGVTGAVLTINDIQGRLVKTVFDLAGGRQVLEIKAGSLPAGIYIYTLNVNGKEAMSKRMVLTR